MTPIYLDKETEQIYGKAVIRAHMPSENGLTNHCFMCEKEAMQLVCDLIKVFQVGDSPIEVIHFPAGVDKAAVLREAADRIEGEDKAWAEVQPTFPWTDSTPRTELEADIRVQFESMTEEERAAYFHDMYQLDEESSEEGEGS